ncbi:TadE/TadG family type IV pilus assembly protein [Arabiibacter massiliensis]|uniref:TadE/TadG family type IV pilus assembly protein n=1 Tax=Arabiibacter massiliensis TaxID=1870985 RepID=UPI0009B94A22|nr:TadE/TadG family type IV pilus assembly protein [Arabiibacter massiliensis]
MALRRPRAGGGYACGGQATVEAAFLIPVLLVGLLLLVQPGILLYDRMVMNAAAAEACRLLATKTDAAGDMAASCEAFVRHRLGSVPPVACFHVHEGRCSWEVRLEGDEGSGTVRASISNEARPLPLIGAAAGLLGIVDAGGNFRIEVEAEQEVQPGWTASAPGGGPAGWVGAWLSE